MSDYPNAIRILDARFTGLFVDGRDQPIHSLPENVLPVLADLERAVTALADPDSEDGAPAAVDFLTMAAWTILVKAQRQMTADRYGLRHMRIDRLRTAETDARLRCERTFDGPAVAALRVDLRMSRSALARVVAAARRTRQQDDLVATARARLRPRRGVSWRALPQHERVRQSNSVRVALAAAERTGGELSAELESAVRAVADRVFTYPDDPSERAWAWDEGPTMTAVERDVVRWV